MRYVREIHPTLDEMMTPLGAEEREEVWQEVEEALRVYETAIGFESPNHVLVIAGTRPIELT